MFGPLIDTHCHLDFSAYDQDRDAVLERALKAGVRRIVIPAVDLLSTERALALADRYEQVYAAVGIHPNDIPIDRDISEVMALLRDATKHPKVVAIGEIGLDYHWDKSSHETQIAWLWCQLELAREVDLPVILHNRKSTTDLLAQIIKWAKTLPESLRSFPGVFHSISANWDEAQIALDLGFMVGFTGPITYKNADETRRIVSGAPAKQILIETDSPFLTPVPHRGARNEPAFVRFIAEQVAKTRGIPLEESCRLTTENACQLFGWDIATI